MDERILGLKSGSVSCHQNEKEEKEIRHFT